MGKFTFAKEERLNSEKWIKELFERGSSFNLYPFRVVYLPHPIQDHPVNQVLISVSIRNFKKAIDRNLLKRRTREGYRLQKLQFPNPDRLLIAYIYTSKKAETFDTISQSI